MEKIKNICFALKSQEHNPKIKEGNLVGIAIQTWHNYIWSSCGYLMVPNDPVAIQNLEKKKSSQEHFFHLQTEMRVEKINEELFDDKGEKILFLGKNKVYVEDPDWGKKIKLLYCRSMNYFTPTKVIKNENNLLHVEIEPMDFYEHGLIDKLIFQGEKINQYRDLVAGNLGKEFEVHLHISKDDPRFPIDTNNWGDKYEKIELAQEKKNSRPEKSVPELKQSLEDYYRKNDIKSMKLSDEDQELMDIIFNDGKKKPASDFPNRYDRQRFEQVKIILKSNGKNSLDYSELISTNIADPDFDKQKQLLKKWMEENDIEEIILKKRNVVLCKKRNNEGSIYLGSEPVGSEKIPEHLRTKIKGVDIGRFFDKIGKNSISRQELELTSDKNQKQNKDNFSWTPWLISGGIVVIFSLFVGFIFWWRKRK